MSAGDPTSTYLVLISGPSLSLCVFPPGSGSQVTLSIQQQAEHESTSYGSGLVCKYNIFSLYCGCFIICYLQVVCGSFPSTTLFSHLTVASKWHCFPIPLPMSPVFWGTGDGSGTSDALVKQAFLARGELGDPRADGVNGPRASGGRGSDAPRSHIALKAENSSGTLL